MDTQRRQWIVMCQVSGGVTGLRESLLKLNQEKNNPVSTASFRYWAEDVDA